jgi:hypothetical protein
MAKRSVKKQRLSDRFDMEDDQVTSAKDFVYKATDLQDHESAQAVRIIKQVMLKYSGRPNTAAQLEQVRDEMLTRLAEINVLATFDPTPCFYGEPPQVTIEGKISSDPIHKYGFDHEKKQYEVLEAKKRNEDYRGQKERNRA